MQILFCDKDKLLLKLIDKKIDPNFHNVITTQNGNKASALLRSIKIDLLITEYQVPYSNGLNLIKQAKEFNKDIKTIVLTFINSETFIKQAEELKIDKYITKPFDLNKLITLIDALANQAPITGEQSFYEQPF